MKSILERLYTFVFCVFHLVPFNKYLNIKSARFFLSKIRGLKYNSLKFEKGKVYRTNIDIQGASNVIVSSSNLSNCKINIYGDNNEVYFLDASLRNLELVVRGKGCKVFFKKNSTCGSAYVVCMGTSNSIEIGEETMIADEVEIWNSDTHPIFDSQGNLTNPSSPILIGNHVWIGKKSTILKGVLIGDNAIIGMNSLVTKDIEPSTVNVGIPTKEVNKNVNWKREYITNFE